MINRAHTAPARDNDQKAELEGREGQAAPLDTERQLALKVMQELGELSRSGWITEKEQRLLERAADLCARIYHESGQPKKRRRL